ncbi:MAG: tyrosine-type recombinase/integrase [Treponema sp.]|jgi:site-specific recombinase XerD|nr:tyrosine-type recombinase/integrase [Treponema sp.]
MDVVYLFHKDGRVVVPFYDYDPDLFKRFIYSGMGHWDNSGKCFVFPGKYVGDERLRKVFDKKPYGIYDEHSLSFTVSNFFDRPWNGSCSVSAAPAAMSRPAPRMNDRDCLAGSLSLPDLFSAGWADRLEAELHSRKYSPRTIKTYLYYNRSFCRRMQKRPEEAAGEDIRDYLSYLDKTRDLSSSSMNLAVSALKFFYYNVMKRDITAERHRPRRDKKLPEVLSESEIQRLLDCEKNPKHRLLLMLAYSSGLRVSEVVVLRKEHIDFGRRTVMVRSGKGRTDRCTLLSDRAAEFLLQYCALYNIRDWIFSGYPSDHHLSIRSAQTIFDKALQKAAIDKQATIHSLRHTFATHLLERGTDIRYIQALLGHAALRTTQRYTHVARRTVLKIQSPLDTLSMDD